MPADGGVAVTSRLHFRWSCPLDHRCNLAVLLAGAAPVWWPPLLQALHVYLLRTDVPAPVPTPSPPVQPERAPWLPSRSFPAQQLLG